MADNETGTNIEISPAVSGEEETTFAEGTYLTAKGIALIGKLLACEGELKLTRVSCGSGTPPEGTSPAP